MEITFLGTGAATALPLPFCNCPLCCKARTSGGKDIRKRSSLAVNDDLLVDLGPDTASAAYLYGFPLEQVQYCLQTHSHSDHFDPAHLVTRLPEYASVGVVPMKVCGSSLTLKHMAEGVFREDEGTDMLSPEGMRRLSIHLHHSVPYSTFSVGRYRITALLCGHDPEDGSMVYCIQDGNRSLLYATDTTPFSQEIWDFLISYEFHFTAVVMDHTYGSGINGEGHLNQDQFIEQLRIMRRTGIAGDHTLVFATHISHEGNSTHSDMEREHAEHGYAPAYDGLSIRI